MVTELSSRNVARILTVALHRFRAEVDPEAPVQRVLTFLVIAAHPDLPQREATRYIRDVGVATVSRNVADMSALTRTRQPGPGIVEQIPDPTYRRRNLLRLTSKGLALMDAITSDVNRALDIDQ